MVVCVWVCVAEAGHVCWCGHMAQLWGEGEGEKSRRCTPLPTSSSTDNTSSNLVSTHHITSHTEGSRHRERGMGECVWCGLCTYVSVLSMACIAVRPSSIDSSTSVDTHTGRGKEGGSQAGVSSCCSMWERARA